MKRFYDAVDIIDHDSGWQVALDGRGVKTASGSLQVVPRRVFAQALAREWDRQSDTIDPATFPLRDLTDYALDVVARDNLGIADKVLRYGETDTLLYRADPDEALYERQREAWEPIVSGFEQREGVRLVRISGIVHRPQPAATMAHLRRRLTALDPFALASVEMAASLTASLIVALEAGEPDADIAVLWRAASLEEDWQAELWGYDEEAQTRRAARKAQFTQAAHWIHLAKT